MATAETPGAFARTYGVELLCAETPRVGKPELLTALRRRLPRIEPLDGDPASDVLAFFHPDQTVDYAGDQVAPAQLFLAVAEATPELPSYEAALQQSWQFRQAREVLATCRGTLLVTDLMASGLEYRTRLGLFQNALAAVLSVVPCRAVYWVRSQQMVDPAWFLRALEEHAPPNPVAGAVNVRLFNVANEPGTCVMDTLGLAALGLPDVQCHFRDLDPTRMAGFLYDLAAYLFERGDVIADGHTVEGFEGDRWSCRHEESLVAPGRVVLDVSPGPPYAAGGREG